MKKKNLDISDTVENAVYRLEFLSSAFGNIDSSHYSPSEPALAGLCDILNGIIEDLNSIHDMWDEQ